LKTLATLYGYFIFYRILEERASALLHVFSQSPDIPGCFYFIIRFSY